MAHNINSVKKGPAARKKKGYDENRLRREKKADIVQMIWLAVGAVLYFLAVCLCSVGSNKGMAEFLIFITLCAALLFFDKLRSRFQPLMIFLGLVVLMDGISCFYAASGKFALNEFLKVLSAFCLALLLLVSIGQKNAGRRAAVVVAGCCAVAGLVSIDLLSTRWLSDPVVAFLGLFTSAYEQLDAVEDGIRMLSIFNMPNPFAACMGIGVLLSLGLTYTEENTRFRAAYLVCLQIVSLSFVLTFSMGACLTILPAFLVLLFMSKKEERSGLLVLMVETLVITLLCAFPISMTSMTAWTGVRLTPLLCVIGGAAALCALDLLWGRKTADWLAGHSKFFLYAVIGLASALLVFVVAAALLTTGIRLSAGEELRRTAYPEPGEYTLSAESDGPVTVIIESQNRADTMMHTKTALYSGPLDQARFTVPEDSLAVRFTFFADKDTYLGSVRYQGSGGSGKLQLKYRLLPAFVANRMQGLRVNQNAIQRFVFFEDGIKLFLLSPVIGRGLGGFENGLRSVQSFDYATKYVHNHYIQTLVDTGIIGLALFLLLLGVSAAAIWRARKKGGLVSALGAAWLFMVGHAMLEVDFSYYAYLPIAFGVFAVISVCCEDTVPAPAWAREKTFRTASLLTACALMIVFSILLACNMYAGRLSNRAATTAELEQAAKIDFFESSDPMLTYVVWSADADVDEETRAKADEYAARLAKLNSNTIPHYLTEYYFKTDREELAFEMAEKYVNYVAASPETWQNIFETLEEYWQDTDTYRAGVLHIAELLNSWNKDNMGRITLNEQATALIARASS